MGDYFSLASNSENLLKNLLVLRSKGVGIFAETTEKVETEAGSKKKMKVRLGVEHQVSREFVIF